MASASRAQQEATPLAHVEVVIFSPGYDPLDHLEPPLSAGEAEEARNVIRTTRERVKRAFVELKYAQLKQAEARKRCAEEAYKKLEADLREAREKMTGLPEHHIVAGAAALASFAACMVAEFAFNQQALPWLLDIPPRSAIGVLLSLAPATAPLILDLVFPRLFALDDLLGRLPKTLSAPATAARQILAKLFWIAVMLTTLASLYLVAECREAAAWVITHKDVTALPEAVRHTQRLTVIALSLVLAVNGALFYLFGMAELRKAWRWWCLRRQAARLEKRAFAAGKELAAAETEVEVKQHCWAQAEAEAEKAADGFQACALLRLQGMLARSETTPKPWDQVQSRLLRGLGFSSGPVTIPNFSPKA